MTLRLLKLLAIPIVLILGWELAVNSGYWPESLIAPPSAVFLAFFERLIDGTLLKHAFVSLRRLVMGYFLGATCAIVLGTLVGVSRRMEEIISPTIKLLSPIPVIAWIPLFIILFGIDGARIALIATGTFLIIFFGTVQGLRSTDYALIELAKVYGKSGYELIFQVLLPSAIPSIVDASRIALALSWILLLAGEVIASSSGLGWLIWDSRNFSRSDDMIVGMIAVGILGWLSDRCIEILQNKWLLWKVTFEGR